jgi:hypothetical protein
MWISFFRCKWTLGIANVACSKIQQCHKFQSDQSEEYIAKAVAQIERYVCSVPDVMGT